MGRKNWTTNPEVKQIQIPKPSKHHDLCCLVAKHFFKRDFNKFSIYKTRYVAVELTTYGTEIADVFGFGGGYTQLFEIKLSRSDFKKDFQKTSRLFPKGIGYFRTYVCPNGIIKEYELPRNWGLLYYNEENNTFECVRKPSPFPQEFVDSIGEMNIVSSILRRENIKSQVFNYRYTNDTIKNKK
jgi:hypothetical protein